MHTIMTAFGTSIITTALLSLVGCQAEQTADTRDRNGTTLSFGDLNTMEPGYHESKSGQTKSDDYHPETELKGPPRRNGNDDGADDITARNQRMSDPFNPETELKGPPRSSGNDDESGSERQHREPDPYRQFRDQSPEWDLKRNQPIYSRCILTVVTTLPDGTKETETECVPGNGGDPINDRPAETKLGEACAGIKYRCFNCSITHHFEITGPLSILRPICIFVNSKDPTANETTTMPGSDGAPMPPAADLTLEDIISELGDKIKVGEKIPRN